MDTAVKIPSLISHVPPGMQQQCSVYLASNPMLQLIKKAHTYFIHPLYINTVSPPVALGIPVDMHYVHMCCIHYSACTVNTMLGTAVVACNPNPNVAYVMIMINYPDIN